MLPSLLLECMLEWFHKKLSLTTSQLSCAIVSFNWMEIWSWRRCLNSTRPASIPSSLGSLRPFWENNEIHHPGPLQGRSWCPSCWQWCHLAVYSAPSGMNSTLLAGVIKAWPSQFNTVNPEWPFHLEISLWARLMLSLDQHDICTSPSAQPSSLSSPSSCASQLLSLISILHTSSISESLPSSQPASKFFHDLKEIQKDF